MLGKLMFLFWEETGKQMHILRNLIALGSKRVFFEEQKREEGTERPSKQTMILYEL